MLKIRFPLLPKRPVFPCSTKSCRGPQMPALIGHYAWLGFLALHMGFLKSVAFFVISQCMCGLFLALVFGLGHNGMATYDADARPDFWKLQVLQGMFCLQPLPCLSPQTDGSYLEESRFLCLVRRFPFLFCL